MSKHTSLTFSLIIFCLNWLTAQDTLWYNAKWQPCPRHKALYFRPQPVQEGNRYRVIDYYINGIKQYEGYSLERDTLIQDGIVVWFYPDGDTSAISTYTKGILDGLTKTYYNNQQIHSIRNYKNGQLQGKLTEYFNDGRISGYANYVGGQLNGQFVKYNYNGKMRYGGKYINDKRDSTWVEYYASGNLKSLYDYVDGVIEGRSHEYGDGDGYHAKFIIQNSEATSVEIYEINYEHKEWRIMDRVGEREHWRVFSDSILIFEYFFEGLNRVGIWTKYDYDGVHIEDQFIHTSTGCSCSKNMLREEFYGKNMSMDKVNAEYMTACRTIHCLNGVNYITMKNGKQKKFEYKNGFEKPEKKQEDFFNSIGSRSIGVKLREPLNYHLEPVIDSMPLVTTENDSLDTLLVRVQKTIFQGVAIRLYTSPNYNDALTAWQKLKPAQNDLIALLSTEYPYQSAIVVGNSLSLKLKNNLYEMREFASFILKIYPESSHSFQAIYKGINNACETIRIENKYTANPKGKKPKVENNNPIFTLVEEMPQFPGGNDSLLVFIQYNVVYPKDAIENDIQGKVFVRFVVYDTGEIGNIEVMKSVHPSLDDEAVRVIAEMPLWQPGKQQGKPVNCYYNIPVNFRLD